MASLQQTSINGKLTIAGTGSIASAATADVTDWYKLNHCVSGTVTLSSAITVDNPNAAGTPDNDRFAYSIATHSGYTVVGAFLEDVQSTNNGAAYLFNATTGAFIRQLVNPNPSGSLYASGDRFGNSVDIYGNYAIVSAHSEQAGSEATSGAAYIYDVTTGNVVRTITNPGAAYQSYADSFGIKVAISDQYFAIASPYEDTFGSDIGIVYLYNLSTGALITSVRGSGASAGLRHVKIRGNYLVYDSQVLGSTQYVNIYNIATGSAVTVANPNQYGTVGDDYGFNFDIVGTTLFVGAPRESSVTNIQEGAVYVYNVTTGALLDTLRQPDADSGFFGYAVAVHGDILVIGSPLSPNGGKVFLYNATTRALQTVISNANAYGTANDDWFGATVSVYGTTIAVGATDEDNASYQSIGKVYMYDYSSNTSRLHIRTPLGAEQSALGWNPSIIEVVGHHSYNGEHVHDFKAVVNVNGYDNGWYGSQIRSNAGYQSNPFIYRSTNQYGGTQRVCIAIDKELGCQNGWVWVRWFNNSGWHNSFAWATAGSNDNNPMF